MIRRLSRTKPIELGPNAWACAGWFDFSYRTALDRRKKRGQKDGSSTGAVTFDGGNRVVSSCVCECPCRSEEHCMKELING